VIAVEFELDGQRITALNGGPQFKFNEAVTGQLRDPGGDRLLLLEAADRGGEEGPCGWLKDRYGLGWQVVPTELPDFFSEANPEGSRRAMQAMLGMRKLDIAALRSAADGRAPNAEAA